ncbi:Hypothetical predicted protein [Paramuricea clavata]|uniref:Uncharacterized protein n=1 Tax=Paramuricea clavata TaxID=317549 RepID=A0A7D9JL41_PARCT|nr:Hypothetical predicted protein [Paramuricea clavata]
MPPKRKTKPSRIKWTESMINDLFECRTRAVETSRLNDTSNAERYGYMKIMKQLWDEKGTDVNNELNQQQIDVAQENTGSLHPVVVDEICNTAEICIERSQIDQSEIPNRIYNTIEIKEAIHISENNDMAHNDGTNYVREDEQIFMWNEINGTDFCDMINDAYEKIVPWKRNVFLVPSGRVGKSFIQELARIYQAFADTSPLECIALKACSVMQSLLLQKPFVKRKVHQAVRLISIADKRGLLSLDALIPDVDSNGNAIWKTTREILLEKHPEGKTPLRQKRFYRIPSLSKHVLIPSCLND